MNDENQEVNQNNLQTNQSVTEPVLEHVEPTPQTDTVVQTSSVMSNTEKSPNNEEKPKKGKSALIAIVAVLLLLIGFICFNFFIRLTGEKNVEKAITGFFTTISEVLTSKETEDIKTITTTGKLDLVIGEETTTLNYDLGLDIKDLIVYLDTDVKNKDQSYLDVMAYLKDSLLYFSTDGGKNIYYTESLNEADISTTKEELEEFSFNQEDLSYLIDTFSKGLENGIVKEKTNRKLDGLNFKTTYELNNETITKLAKSGFEALLDDSKAVTILEETFEINKEDFKEFVEDITVDEDDEEDEKIADLVVYNNIVTGVCTKAEIIVEDVKVEFTFGSENKIALYYEDTKVATITYNDEKVAIDVSYEIKEELSTVTISLNLTSNKNGNTFDTNGTVAYKLTSEQYSEYNMDIKLNIADKTELNGTVKSLDSKNAVNYDKLTDEDKEKAFGGLDNVGDIASYIISDLIYSYTDEDYVEQTCSMIGANYYASSSVDGVCPNECFAASDDGEWCCCPSVEEENETLEEALAY